MKKILLMLSVLGLVSLVDGSAGAGAFSSATVVNPLSAEAAAYSLQNSESDLEYFADDETLSSSSAAGKIYSDWIGNAKNWLGRNIGMYQQNIDLTKQKHPIQWADPNRSPLVSADDNFVNIHADGLASVMEKEIANILQQNPTWPKEKVEDALYKKLPGYLCMDESNMGVVANQVLSKNLFGSITYISVHAADVGVKIGEYWQRGPVWNAIDTIFTQRSDLILVVNFTHNDQTNLFKIPDSIKNLIVAGKNVTQIGDDFLFYCNKLTILDLSGLKNVTEIGNSFLFGCTGLTELDLSPLQNVTIIGNDFLSECDKLTILDLSPLQKVKAIGNNFLYGCSGLKELNLFPLRKVRAIRDSFLHGCSGLTKLNLFPLPNKVKAIGDKFLSSCSGLTKLDLYSLQNVTTIGDDFLYECSGLTKLDLSPLQNVTAIGDKFLSKCFELIQLNLSGLKNVTRIKNGFLAHCIKLTQLDLSP